MEENYTMKKDKQVHKCKDSTTTSN